MARKRNSLLQGIDLFRRLSPQLVVSDLIIFLYICENEGINVSELAQITGITEASASRRARALAPPDMNGAIPPSVGLVEAFQGGEDGRVRLLFLTAQGRLFRDQLEDIIAKASPILQFEDDERRAAR